MSQKKTRVAVYIRSEGPNPRAIKDGLSWLDSVCKSTGKHSALLAFLGKEQSQDVMSEVVGKDLAKALAKSGHLKLPNSAAALSLMTERDRPFSCDGPALVVYPNKKLLDVVDSLFGVTHVLVIPWTLKEIQYWIDTWNAYELGTQPAKPTKRLVSNPVVEEALKDLTATVNVSTGLSHPLDRASAIDLFRKLKAAGEHFDPEEVRAWLVAEGNWNPEDADDVANVAKGIIEGKRFKETRSRWRNDIVNIWKEEAGKGKTESATS
jgi:uncharacterized protein (DUF2267 family)